MKLKLPVGPMSVEGIGAIQAALPRCMITLGELEQRTGEALFQYTLEATVSERWHSNPAQKRKLRQDLLKSARSLQHLMSSPDFRHAIGYAVGPMPLRAQQIASFIEWVEAAEQSTPKLARGGVKDSALDNLITTLIDIYRDATGDTPTSSRNGNDPTPHGPWIDFFFSVISVLSGTVPVQSQGKVITRDTFIEAFDTRWRRLVRRSQKSEK